MKEFEKDWSEAEDESEIKLLIKSKQRHQIVDKGLSRISKMQFNKVFNEFRRDIELVHIAKVIQHTPASLTNKVVTAKKPIEKKVDDVPIVSSYNSYVR